MILLDKQKYHNRNFLIFFFFKFYIRFPIFCSAVRGEFTNTFDSPSTYRISKKSCFFSYSTLLYKTMQDFLEIHHVFNIVPNFDAKYSIKERKYMSNYCQKALGNLMFVQEVFPIFYTVSII